MEIVLKELVELLVSASPFVLTLGLLGGMTYVLKRFVEYMQAQDTGASATTMALINQNGAMIDAIRSQTEAIITTSTRLDADITNKIETSGNDIKKHTSEVANDMMRRVSDHTLSRSDIIQTAMRTEIKRVLTAIENIEKLATQSKTVDPKSIQDALAPFTSANQRTLEAITSLREQLTTQQRLNTAHDVEQEILTDEQT